MRFGEASVEIPREVRLQRRLRMRRLGCGHGAATIMVAAAGAADGALISFRPVALVGGLAKTAGVRWRSGDR